MEEVLTAGGAAVKILRDRSAYAAHKGSVRWNLSWCREEVIRVLSTRETDPRTDEGSF